MVYLINCVDCGEHYRTDSADRAWDEATAHERATGHETRVDAVRAPRGLEVR